MIEIAAPERLIAIGALVFDVMTILLRAIEIFRSCCYEVEILFVVEEGYDMSDVKFGGLIISGTRCCLGSEPPKRALKTRTQVIYLATTFGRLGTLLVGKISYLACPFILQPRDVYSEFTNY